MAITVFTQSNKNLAPIYIRVRQGGDSATGKGIDAKAKTGLLIDPERFERGVFKDYRTPKGATAKVKVGIKEKQKALNEISNSLDAIIGRVKVRLNNRQDYEVINSDWLKEVVTPKKSEISTLLYDYFDYYLKVKNNEIAPATVKKYKVAQSLLNRFQEVYGIVYIAKVDKAFKREFYAWMQQEGYSPKYKVKALKIFITMCYHAGDESELSTSPQLYKLARNEKSKDASEVPQIYLNHKDLKKIREVKLKRETLEIARDWLLISCDTGQRISDFMRFERSSVGLINGYSYLTITQQKTGEQVAIYLTDEVKKIMDKYGDGFPPAFSNNVDSNNSMYNKLIKEVCKDAEIDEIVRASLRLSKTNRYETREVPKYKAVSSHIGRRSFASNYYGSISTVQIMSQTGHRSEKQFLDYVKLPKIELAKQFAESHRSLMEARNTEVKLTIVKGAVNE